MQKHLIRLVFAALFGLGMLLTAAPLAQAQDLDHTDPTEELAAKIEAEGPQPVIVQLDVGWQVDGFRSLEETSAQDAQIRSAQADILATVEADDVQNVKRYDYVPFLALTVNSPAALAQLAAHPAVKGIEPDELVAPLLDDSVEVIRAHHAHTLFYKGDGQTVAVLDTGVDKFHPQLQGRVVAEACFSSTVASQNATSLCPGGVASSTANNSGLDCAAGISGCDHGTHVAGIVNGVAPNANLIAVQVFSRITDGGSVNSCANANRTSPCTLAYTSDIISALNYVLTRTSQFDIAAVNMSLGGGSFASSCNNDARKPSIELLRGQNVATVISAGNSGFVNSMGAPACISAAISVAASDKNDGVASFTNLNSLTTLFATGVNIEAPVPGTIDGFKSGTSMAAPHVAGAFAIFRQLDPNRSVEAMRSLLVATGPSISDTRSGGSVTKRRLDVYTVLANLISIDQDDFRTVASPSTTSGLIAQNNDRDHYYLFASAGQRVTVRMNRTSGSHDPYLELYNPNGTRIAINNNGGPGTNALLNGVNLPITGRYLIVARSNNSSTGTYSLVLSAETVNLNPRPQITRLVPNAVTGSALASDFWVRIDGQNFSRSSRVYLNGSPRGVFYSSPNRVWIRMRGSDINFPWPATKFVTVSNPAPGGGFSPPVPLAIRFPFLGESELVTPETETTIETGVETSFEISWTTPITIPSWRNMQFMDLRLRDDQGNVAAWVRVRELPGEESTYRLVNGAEVSVSTGITDTVPGPDEGLPGEDRTIELPDTVSLNLANSTFSGSGRTAIMSPALTFGPDAVGTYNIEFRVDGEDGTVQDDDILGQLHIVPNGCPVAIGDVTLTGPGTGATDTEYVYTAAITPADATTPFQYTWSPEPIGGQGTPSATYRWDNAGEKQVAVSVENCGAFGGATLLTRVRTTEAPDLAIVKTAPAVAEAGDPITYTLRITNSGAITATALEITDVLPQDADYQSGGTLVDELVVWNLAELGGYGATAEVELTVSATKTITNSIINVTADGDYSAFRTDPVVTQVVDARAEAAPLAATELGFGAGATRALTQLPAGSVPNPTVLALDDASGPSRPLPPNLTYAGRTLRLDAFTDNVRRPGLALNEGISITVGIDVPAVARIRVATTTAAEPTLVLWDGDSWRSDGITCGAASEPDALRCTVAAPRATEFALVIPGETTLENRLFMPIVKK